MNKRIKRLSFALLAILIITAVFPANISADEGLPEIRIVQSVVNRDSINIYYEILTPENERIIVKYDDLTIRITDSKGNEVPFYCEGIADDTGRGKAYILAVDISGSNDDYPDMKRSMLRLVDSLSDFDKAAILTFGDDITVVQEFTGDKKELKDAIGSIRCTDRWTKLYSGIKSSISLFEMTLNIPDRRSIIVYSDGFDYDQGGDYTAEEIIADMEKSPKVFPIYGLQYNTGGNAKKEQLINDYSDIIKASRGKIITYAGKGVLKGYDVIYDMIANQNCLNIEMNAPADTYTIEISTEYEDYILTDSLEFYTNVKLESDNIGDDMQDDENTDDEDDKEKADDDKDKDDSDEDKDKDDDDEEDDDDDKKSGGIGEFFDDNKTLLFVALGVILLIIIGLIVLSSSRKSGRKTSTARTSRGSMGGAAAGVDTSKATNSLSLYLKPFETDEFSGVTVNVVDQVVIGSDNSQCDVVYSGEEVMPQHFVLHYESDKLYIFNISNDYQTFINGYKLESKRELRNNDIVSFGSVEIQIIF